MVINIIAIFHIWFLLFFSLSFYKTYTRSRVLTRLYRINACCIEQMIFVSRICPKHPCSTIVAVESSRNIHHNFTDTTERWFSGIIATKTSIRSSLYKFNLYSWIDFSFYSFYFYRLTNLSEQIIAMRKVQIERFTEMGPT